MPGHRDGDVDAEALPGTARHRLGDLRRDGAVLLDQLRRHAELLDLDLVRVGDDPADDHVASSRAPTVSRAAIRPPVQDSAVAS